MDDLDRALTRLQRARTAEAEALEALHDVIRQRLDAGPRGTQAELVRRTGYTRERLRQIRNDATSTPQHQPADRNEHPSPHSGNRAKTTRRQEDSK
ncbi:MULTISPECIES: hypothetical protein [Mycobacteriaceae]|uniref:hypothetical protein n=1 Tax=Mycobacteriaceae TaxID=1762 RepID=UPI000515A9D8|nr:MULTISPECIES: hypothetical protein [Mycobacteriaceae]